MVLTKPETLKTALTMYKSGQSGLCYNNKQAQRSQHRYNTYAIHPLAQADGAAIARQQSRRKEASIDGKERHLLILPCAQKKGGGTLNTAFVNSTNDQERIKSNDNVYSYMSQFQQETVELNGKSSRNEKRSLVFKQK